MLHPGLQPLHTFIRPLSTTARVKSNFVNGFGGREVVTTLSCARDEVRYTACQGSFSALANASEVLAVRVDSAGYKGPCDLDNNAMQVAESIQSARLASRRTISAYCVIMVWRGRVCAESLAARLRPLDRYE